MHDLKKEKRPCLTVRDACDQRLMLKDVHWNNNGALFLLSTAALQPLTSTGTNKLWYNTKWWRKPTGVCVPVPQPRAAPTADASRGTHEGMFIFAGHVGAYSLDRGPVCNFYTPHPLLSYVSCYYYDSNGGYTFLAQGSGAARRNSNAQKMKISGKLSSFFLPTLTLLAVCMCP